MNEERDGHKCVKSLLHGKWDLGAEYLV